MANTYTLIASSTVGAGGASSIDFTSIPSTYTDLLLKVSSRSSDASVVAGITVQFNSDTTSGNYTWKRLYGDGSSAPGSDSNFNFVLISAANNTANTFGNGEIYISNYAGSSAKSISADSVSENNATNAYAILGAGKWSGTSAITSIKLVISAGNFVQYSTAYLYGIKNS